MRDENAIVRERQLAIRREMDRRGISLKAVAFDSGIPYPTIVSYFPGERDKQPATIGCAALWMLCEKRALPLDLLSLLLPTGFAIVALPEGLDHDDLEQAALDYIACKSGAHHPDSPAGREIAPCEAATLTGKAVRLRVAA